MRLPEALERAMRRQFVGPLVDSPESVVRQGVQAAELLQEERLVLPVPLQAPPPRALVQARRRLVPARRRLAGPDR